MEKLFIAEGNKHIILNYKYTIYENTINSIMKLFINGGRLNEENN
nr:hypothetical protein NZ312_09150 [Clostridioides difficile]